MGPRLKLLKAIEKMKGGGSSAASATSAISGPSVSQPSIPYQQPPMMHPQGYYPPPSHPYAMQPPQHYVSPVPQFPPSYTAPVTSPPIQVSQPSPIPPSSSTGNRALSAAAEGLCCPITAEIMVDPVVIADGTTYEREAIEKWFENNKTSPATGKVVAHKKLTPNIAVRQTIEAYREEKRREEQQRQQQQSQ